MAKMRELPIPPDAEPNDRTMEIFRGWIVDNKLQCSLAPWVWKDTPEVWGILLADVVHHLCNALEKETNLSRAELFRIITKKLFSELESPSAEHEGDFLENTGG